MPKAVDNLPVGRRAGIGTPDDAGVAKDQRASGRAHEQEQMNSHHVTPVDRAAPSADHPDRGLEPGSGQRRPRAHAHRERIGGLQGHDQRHGLAWSNARAAGQRVVVTPGLRAVVDANHQIDRLGRRVVDRDRERLRR